MRRILGLLGSFVLGTVAWWLGGLIGIATGAVLGTVGSVVGLWWGLRWFDENLK